SLLVGESRLLGHSRHRSQSVKEIDQHKSQEQRHQFPLKCVENIGLSQSLEARWRGGVWNMCKPDRQGEEGAEQDDENDRPPEAQRQQPGCEKQTSRGDSGLWIRQ